MKRPRANVAEKNPDPDPESLIRRSTSKKEKRQVASATISKAPTSSLVDFENDLINISTRDSLGNDFTRIMTDTPIYLINGDSDFENQRVRLASTLQDLTNIITKRQKVIQLADKSSGGWSTIDKYLLDELASDSKRRQKDAAGRGTSDGQNTAQKANEKLRFGQHQFKVFEPLDHNHIFQSCKQLL